MSKTEQLGLEPISECCGAPMTGHMVDVGLCPECKEHCEVVE